MGFITDLDLAGRTDVEPAASFHMVSEALAATTPGAPARQIVIASLQNISRPRRPATRNAEFRGLSLASAPSTVSGGDANGAPTLVIQHARLASLGRSMHSYGWCAAPHIRACLRHVECPRGSSNYVPNLKWGELTMTKAQTMYIPLVTCAAILTGCDNGTDTGGGGDMPQGTAVQDGMAIERPGIICDIHGNYLDRNTLDTKSMAPTLSSRLSALNIKVDEWVKKTADLINDCNGFLEVASKIGLDESVFGKKYAALKEILTQADINKSTTDIDSMTDRDLECMHKIADAYAKYKNATGDNEKEDHWNRTLKILQECYGIT